MVALRRPTVNSKASSTTTVKSLSAISLTKKTSALELDLEELKQNLELQSQEVNQRDETLQELVNKVDMLHDAFTSLSDVVTCEVEEMHKKLAITSSNLQDRVNKLEHSFQALEAQVQKDEKYDKVQETFDRRYHYVQELCSKIDLSLHESRAELAFVKSATKDLMTREQDTVQVQKSFQIAQEDVSVTLKRLKEETSQFQVELITLKDQTTGTLSSIASDVQVLADAYSVLRSSVAKQQSKSVGNFKKLQETLEQQGRNDQVKLTQRMDALSDAIASRDLRTKYAIDDLVKNDDRKQCAVDECLTLCSREIRAIRNEVKYIQNDQQVKLDQMTKEMAKLGQHYNECHNLRR